MNGMSRWLKGILWIGGTCILWCPMCISLYGAGTVTICLSVIVLMTTILCSGYAIWNIISHLVSKGTDLHPYFKSAFHYLVSLFWKEENSSIPESINSLSLVTGSHLEEEICVTAQTFHTQFILPWYSFISPDDKYSLQVKSILEDLLLNVSKTLHENVKPSVLIKSVIDIYVLHFRQFVKTLRKIPNNTNAQLSECMGFYQEIENSYIPLHSSLKSSDGIDSYCCRLSHTLLQNYIPSEIVKCELLFISLRDLIAQNVIRSLLDQLCDTQWLNGIMSSCLDGGLLTPKTSQEASHEVNPESPDNKERSNQAKAFSYLHSLSCIKEENSIDLQDFDCSDVIEISKKDILDKIPEAAGENCRDKEISLAENQKKVDLKKLDSAEALLNYVKSSSVESKETSQCELSISNKSVSSALGTLISTTTVPLLPDQGGLSALPFSLPFKMWESPVEEKNFLIDVKPMKKVNPFKRSIVEGMKEEDYKMLFTNRKNLVSKDDSILEISKKKKHSYLKSKSLKKFSTDKLFFSKAQLPRSNSLDDVKDTFSKADSEEKSDKDSLSSSRLSFSSEGIECLVNWSSSIEEEERGKERGHLVKMSSFDKNDGIDVFSPESQIAKDNFASPPMDFESSQSGIELTNTQVNDAFSPQLSSLSNCDFKQESFEQKDVSRALSSATSTPSSTSTLAIESAVDATSLEKVLPTLEALSIKDENKAAFGWENPDLSPIYEESENLASSIAKLRSLLSERESHSLGSQSSFGSSESEPRSAQSDPGRCTLERSRFTFLHKDSSGSLASVKSTSSSESFGHCVIDEELTEAAEVPLDGRIFTSISIPSTEVHSEHGGFQYTSYIIQYDAIYLCEQVQVNSEPPIATGQNAQAIEHRMVLQTNFVKRRFREFLALHSKFEDDSSLRIAMKGVKGPNKWLNLPFSKLDSATISSRKQFLEKYLQAIIQRLDMNISVPLKEFLAYGSDGSVSFVKKPLEINVPRLDKLLARTVSGVFHSIKTALPNFDSIEMSLPSSLAGTSAMTGSTASSSLDPATRMLFSGSDKSKVSSSVISSKRSFDVQLDITAEEEVCEMEEALIAIVSMSSFQNTPIEVAFEAEEFGSSTDLPSFRQQVTDLKSILQEASPTDFLPPIWSDIPSSNCIKTDEATEYEDNVENEREDDTFFKALLDAFVEIISCSSSSFNHLTLTRILSHILSQPVSTHIEEKVNSFFCDENISKWFKEMRQQLMRLCHATFDAPTQDLAQSRQQLKDALNNFLPSMLPYFIGEDLTQESIDLFVESLQHPIVMRDFGLHLLDLIFVQMLLPI